MPAEPYRVDFPVEYGDREGHFAGFVYRARGRSRSTLQVLVHGNSYDHRYWDAGQINGANYSYAHYMTERGYDVLAIDLPGVGASSKPNGRSVTIRTVGEAISRAVGAVREGGVTGTGPFERVVLVGHSLGGLIGVYAEANWPCADAVLVLGTGFYSGRATSGWAPGVREKLLLSEYARVPADERLKFYFGPAADPVVIAFDNAELRSSIPSRLWSDVIEVRDGPNPVAPRVRCPVFVQLSDEDPIMLGRYASEEREIYTASPRVVVERLTGIGHCFNLHLNRHESWDRIAVHLSGLQMSEPPAEGQLS